MSGHKDVVVAEVKFSTSLAKLVVPAFDLQRGEEKKTERMNDSYFLHFNSKQKQRKTLSFSPLIFRYGHMVF